jgi:SAM-dependent methyltransferase
MDVAVFETPVLTGLRTAHVREDAWIELGVCPICRRSERVMEVSTVSAARAVGASFAACTSCEHIFCRRRPSASWFEGFYRQSWDERGRRRADNVEPDVAGARRLGTQLAPGARVLDAGAGLGHTALGLRSLGFDVSVSERSSHRAKRLAELGFPTFESGVEAIEVEAAFDLVHLKHVLEHVDDPDQAIAACARLVAENALIYIAVPHWRGEHALQSFHFVPHLSLFSRRSLLLLLDRHGFEPVVVESDRELRVLAKRTGAARDVPVDASFERSLSTWVGRSVGEPGPVSTAIWWNGHGADVYYDSSVVQGAARAAVAASTLRLRRARRIGPWIAARIDGTPPNAISVRALRFRATGEELPVRLVYNDAAPPIWLK